MSESFDESGAPDWAEIRRRLSEKGDFDVKSYTGKAKQEYFYIDARDVMDRLDAVVGPANWSAIHELLDRETGAVRCTMEGCHRPIRAHGMCGMHYLRWKRHGDPRKIKHEKRNDPMTLWDKFVVDENGCWIFQGRQLKGGYCQMSIGGMSFLAHRLACEYTYGPLEPGLLACHSCDNPPCICPHHLFPGTHQDNTNDQHAKGRHLYHGRHWLTKQPHVVRGEKNGNARVSDREAETIAILYQTGAFTQRELAGTYGISQRTVGRIAHGIRRTSISQYRRPA